MTNALALPVVCRWQGALTDGYYECRSPKIVDDAVPHDWCGRCPYRDHPAMKARAKKAAAPRCPAAGPDVRRPDGRAVTRVCGAG